MPIVLRRSLPGVLSTAISTYLVSWNDYLVAVVFLRTQTNYTRSVADDLTFATAIADAAADIVRHRAVTA